MVLPVDVRFCTNSCTNANLGPRFKTNPSVERKKIVFSVVNAKRGFIFDVVK